MTETDRTPDAALEDRCVDTIRFLAVDAVQKANSGHPGMPMALAPGGPRPLHASPALRPEGPGLAGPRPLRALRRSRQHAALRHAAPDRLRPLARRPQGLPPVGQQDAGAPRARGHARRRDDDRPARPGPRATPSAWRSPRRTWPPTFNDAEHQVVDHRTYVIAGDGDLMEGVASEAASLAGHLAPGQAHRPLRRQPHQHRRQHRPRLHRGPGQALRGLRLARAAGRGRQRPRGDRRRPDGGGGRDGAAVVHRRAHAHRLRLAAQAGHGGRARRAARRRRGGADQGEPRLAARA